MAALLLAVISLLFFFPDALEGRVLQQHDIMQGLANGHEIEQYQAETGVASRWTDALFGGMPTFQIAPSYPANSLLGWFTKVYTLWLPSPANLLFAMMLGFFIMCLCMKFKWPTALFAALAWGFSTYFIIIIGAGHIWKFLALSYIPPTIGGIALCYRGRYLAGGAMTALFGALQLQSNHPQMSYYFGFVMLALILGWLWYAWREKRLMKWSVATLTVMAAGVLAVGANSASLYNSLEYSKETVRGRATEIVTPGKETPSAGADHAYITQWSYGVDETLSLLIPNIKGGASIKPEAGVNKGLGVLDTPKGREAYLTPEEAQVANGFFLQYFGNQPMTNGPVYVGAFVLMLAILAMLTVHGKWETPTKWALFAAAVLSILLSWGHNFAPLTDWFIDNFPGYNKFRTVASILVIVEFCIPLLAALCLRQMLGQKDYFARNKMVIIAVMGCGLFICLLGWVAPSVFGQPFSVGEIETLEAAGALHDPAYRNIIDTASAARLGLVSADSMRSFFFLLAGCVLLYLKAKNLIKNSTVWVCCLSAVVLLDLFSVNKRYLDSASFTAPLPAEEKFEMTDADRAILADKGHYRVFDQADFNGARSSYFHKTIGGYHAAKLTRYNDLLTHQISKGNPAVINMLNAKYILNGNTYSVNPGALGNAWFVENLRYVDTPNAEMDALDTLDPAVAAVADSKFREILGKAEGHSVSPTDKITLTSYAPNRLTYKSHSQTGGVAVFSEIYFPWGWTATVDGKEMPIGRVNYVLRAMNLPAGDHEIVMTFDPQSLKTTNIISVVCVALIWVMCADAVCFWFIRLQKRRKEEKDAV